jgi:hypothetical protein
VSRGLFIAPRPPIAVGTEFKNLPRPNLLFPSLERVRRWCTRHVTIHWPVHQTMYYSLEVHWTSYYSLACAPDMLIFTSLCTCEINIHCHVHWTCYYSLSCAPSISTLSAFSPFFLHLTSTFGMTFLRLRQTHLEYNLINLVPESYLFPILLSFFLFFLKQSLKW